MAFKKGNISWNKGKKTPLGVREKLSRAHQGKKLSEEHKRKIADAHSGVKYKTMSEEGRRNLSVAHMGQKSWNRGLTKESGVKGIRWGSQINTWKGGITPKHEKIRRSLRYIEWRKSILERDDYTCQFCDKRGGNLNADHIKPFAYFPELRFAMDNGRTLCKPCHLKTDTWGRRYKPIVSSAIGQ